MADLNSVNILGRAVRDPEMRNGGAVTFTIANNGTNESVNYLPVVCFGKTAENVAKYVRKGKQVAINGRVTQDSYEAKDGSKRSSIEIVAYQVQFLGDTGNRDVAPEDIDEEVDLSTIPF